MGFVFLKRCVCVDEGIDTVGSVCLERPGSVCVSEHVGRGCV